MKYYSPSRKAFFDDEIRYNNLPEDLISITDAQHSEYIDAMNNNGKEITIVNGNITLTDRVFRDTWSNIRYVRNMRLKASDYTQLPDFSGNTAAWATYRQALRDITTQFSDPNDVVWPVAPGA